jgi:hypothetical protein
MWILIVCGVLLALAVVFVFWCCCAVSSQCSREEEREAGDARPE